jgi:hypothetical protein
VTSTSRRRALAALAGVALLWPALQHGLSRAFDSDPWELFGFAMYTVPHPRIQAELRVTVDGRERALRPAGSLRRELDAHLRRKTTLGRWVSDEAFARRLLDRHADWGAVTLVFHHWQLDRRSARWVVTLETRTVERAGASDLPTGRPRSM